MKKELLKKYLNKNCTDKEFNDFVGWVKEESAKKEGKNWVFEDWKSFEPDIENKDDKKYSALLDKIHHKINLKEQQKGKVVTMHKIALWLTRVAAILFLPLLGILFYMHVNSNFQTVKYKDLAVDSLEIISPVGSRTVVQLSDGTIVFLNYGSKMKYPRNFTGKTRQITLTGEGYFDVSHDPDRPFIVKAGRLSIKALGTEFDVRAYSQDDVVATTLVKGKVVVEKTIPGEKTKPIGVMVPGQHVVYHSNSGKIYLTKGKIEKYIAWKDGKMVFDNEPITVVARRLGRKFNVDIEVADDIKDYTYTFTSVNDPLFLVLDLMTEVTDISYKKFPRKKLPNGTFSKLKIRIEKRQ